MNKYVWDWGHRNYLPELSFIVIKVSEIEGDLHFRLKRDVAFLLEKAFCPGILKTS